MSRNENTRKGIPYRTVIRKGRKICENICVDDRRRRRNKRTDGRRTSDKIEPVCVIHGGYRNTQGRGQYPKRNKTELRNACANLPIAINGKKTSVWIDSGSPSQYLSLQLGS